MCAQGPRVIDDNRPPKGWPTRGEIVVDGLRVRYRPELADVLSGVNVAIHSR